MPNTTTSNALRIEISQPKLLNARAMLVFSAYGLVLVLPVVLSMLYLSMTRFGILTFLIPLAAILADAFFLPLGFGNPYVGKVVRSLNPEAARDRAGFIVQLTFIPRLRSGMRALIEDADDIGWLSFTESALVYQGDSVRLSIPFRHIQDVRIESTGWRGLFLYGPRTMVAVSGLPNATSLHFAERSSWLLPGSRRASRALYERLLATQRKG